MLDSLRVRLGLLFLAFFVLLSVSVAATLWAVDTQRQDAVLINLAGRQRMLLQQVARDALHIEHDGSPEAIRSLGEAAGAFEQTLHALQSGGTVAYPPGRSVAVPATQDPAIRAALAQVEGRWAAARKAVGSVAAGAADEIEALGSETAELGRLSDEVVRRYEAAATLKVKRLRAIQLAFFAAALALLPAGFWSVRRSLVRPLQRLGAAADRIGRGDLETPIEPSGPAEIRWLGRNLEAMRADMAASHRAQQAWAGELEARVAQRTRELAALREVSHDISAQLDVGHVLQSVTDKARELLAADVAVLCLLEEPGTTLAAAVVSGPREALCGERTSAGSDECLGCCAILDRPFRASHLVASLHVGRQASGALCVGGRAAGQFGGEAALLLTELANSAAIALENARLYERAEQAAALEERQRIAAEMHDGLAQMVGYLGMQVDRAADLVAAGRNADAAGQLERLRGAAEQASAEVRRAIASLQQTPQPPQSLQEQLARLVADQPQAAELDLPPADPLMLAPDECEQVLRVAGEALANARRHAGARRVAVRLERAVGEARLTVEDDGRGFDPAAPPPEGQHFGLSIMRARAARLGGTLAVSSQPGRGTRVTLTWPLRGGG